MSTGIGNLGLIKKHLIQDKTDDLVLAMVLLRDLAKVEIRD
jgi:hypothetical protein